jgi:hypothetical protein
LATCCVCQWKIPIFANYLFWNEKQYSHKKGMAPAGGLGGDGFCEGARALRNHLQCRDANLQRIGGDTQRAQQLPVYLFVDSGWKNLEQHYGAPV